MFAPYAKFVALLKPVASVGIVLLQIVMTVPVLSLIIVPKCGSDLRPTLLYHLRTVL